MPPNGNNAGYNYYTDPNYYAGWNNVLGSLGGAVGTWYQAFQQGTVTTVTPPPPADNTILYVVIGIVILLVLFLLFLYMRKS